MLTTIVTCSAQPLPSPPIKKPEFFYFLTAYQQAHMVTQVEVTVTVAETGTTGHISAAHGVETTTQQQTA
jgi:hypothetical protein